MSVRVLRLAVLSSIVLCASRALAAETAPGSASASATSVTPPRLIRSQPAIEPEGPPLTEPVAVTLSLTIDELGRVAEITVVESGGERF
ncbi:MAG TPA: hypothetical protein VFK05_08140, partial [Polyangiaceae bacterium]|nr:hypothetical protein [Polyangiaceae bacterium]